MKLEIPIYEYHDIREHSDDIDLAHSPYVIRTQEFDEQMNWLHRNDYHTAALDDLISGEVDEKTVIITFDDGDISNYEIAFPILTKYKMKATFFVVPAFIDKIDSQRRRINLSKQQIEQMSKSGMRFESHSLTHPYLFRLSSNNIHEEMRKSKIMIEEIVNREVRHFCVPFGFYDGTMISIAEKSGYKSLVTEDYGYYNYLHQSDVKIQIMPRFTIKAGLKLEKFIHIAEKRKLFLLGDYIGSNALNAIKNLIGFNSYIKLRSNIFTLLSHLRLVTENRNKMIA